MPIERKTLSELNTQIQSELPLQTAKQPLRINFFLPFGSALAGTVHGIYGYQDWLWRQIFPISCDEDTLINYHAPLYLRGGQKEPAAATGPVTISGNPGATVEQGALLNRSDGVQFALVDGVIIGDTGAQNTKVICTTPGITGNTPANTDLQLATSYANINNQVTVPVPGLTGGAELETVTQLRNRVIRSRIKGSDVGRDIDWEEWAKEVPGVSRAWAVPKAMGLGSTLVYFVRDEQTPIFPETGEITAVLSHLETTGQPNGEIFVASPIPKPVDFRIVLHPDNPTVREGVTTALQQFLNGKATPVKKNKFGRTEIPAEGLIIQWSKLGEVISGVAGEDSHVLHEPAGDIVCTLGEYVQLGEITWS